MRRILFLSVVFVAVGSEMNSWNPVSSTTSDRLQCKDNKDIVVTFEEGLQPEDDPRYFVSVNKAFPKDCNVTIVFDSQVDIAFVVKTNKDEYDRRTPPISDTFSFQIIRQQMGFNFTVQGTEPGVVPYMLSFSVNGVQFCGDPKLVSQDAHSNTCGRQAVQVRELKPIELRKNPANYSGPTMAGDWPWHVAIQRKENSVYHYLCGGTLIAKHLVLTAGHCVINIGTLKPYPSEDYNVLLGKYGLMKPEEKSQGIKVHEIIVHKDFDVTRLHNDIALLKLKTEVVLNDFIQPACLLQSDDINKISSGQILGTIVGWGYDDNDTLAQTLLQATIPIVSDANCTKSKPSFFGLLLNGNNFCAGYGDGTAPCNGDSGGAFQVFIPDEVQKDKTEITGTWHVRGVLSMGMVLPDRLICDPKEYVIFTDVNKFKDWIDQYWEAPSTSSEVTGKYDSIITAKFGEKIPDEGERCLICNTSSDPAVTEPGGTTGNKSQTAPLPLTSLVLLFSVILLLID